MSVFGSQSTALYFTQVAYLHNVYHYKSVTTQRSERE